MSVAKRRLMEVTPDWRDVAPQDQVRYIVPGLFAGVRVEPMLADLARIIPDWQPDLLIHDSAEMAGAMAAEVVAIPTPSTRSACSGPSSSGAWRRRRSAPVADRLGVANPGIGGLGGELYLDVCPPGSSGRRSPTCRGYRPPAGGLR